VLTAIAWATDGSAAASDALPLAVSLARTTGAELIIIHVQEITISRSGFLTEDHRALLASLHRTARRLRDDNIHATVWSSSAIPADVPRKILELAKTAAADVLVVGSRGHGSVMNLLLGSVTTRLIQSKRLPIIAVPPPSATPHTSQHVPGRSPGTRHIARRSMGSRKHPTMRRTQHSATTSV
jgi:nucleotide-binding universal stress UspA family protein